MENGVFRKTPQNQSENNYFNIIDRYLNTANNVSKKPNNATKNTKYTLHGLLVTMKIIIFYNGLQMNPIPWPRYFHLLPIEAQLYWTVCDTCSLPQVKGLLSHYFVDSRCVEFQVIVHSPS